MTRPPPPAVIDTDVIVAGLLTADAASPPAKILDGMLAGRIPFLLSEALLAEYREGLVRPRIRDRHALIDEEIDRLLTALVTVAMIRHPDPRTGAPDPKDDHLWSLVLESRGACLVTGDIALVRSPPAAVLVLSPREFVEALVPASER
jgi:putative PIN family toxin of toxin-antitoxin system